jgi:Holliday junction DNA helicase RuvA
MNKLFSLNNIMIGYLCGNVLSLSADRCVICVSGIGYVVRFSQRFLESIACGDKVQVWIEHVMHEGDSSLFGFEKEIEQQWFRWLTGVPGVGGRAALCILSAFTPNQLCHALVEKDIASLRRAEGVGSKLAERLVTELGKRAKEQVSISIEEPPMDSRFQESVMALSQLGYGRVESEKAVRSVLQSYPQHDVSEIIVKTLEKLK